MTPTFTRLSCALVATAALVTTLAGPASAAPESLTASTDSLSSTVETVDGEVISTLTDKATGEPATFDADQFGTLPTDATRSGGAVLGQSQKTESDLDKLALGGSASFLEQAAEQGMGGAAAYSSWRPAGIQGLDVSAYQTSMNWTGEYKAGARFAYVKATEGRYYKSPAFNAQYTGAQQAGMIRGAYHFANPEVSTGAEQADYFINNGGGWSADGKTLPGLLDMEQNPYGQSCYNKTPAQLVSWIKDFSNRYKARTGRVPAIYTGAYWWNDCTGNSKAFSDHPMHLASYGVSTPWVYPAGWSRYDMWQYSDTGPFVMPAGGDSNVFGGTAAQLSDLAENRYYKPLGGTAPAGTPTVVAPAPAVAPASGTPFADVLSSHVFAGEITWMHQSGISTGWKRADGTSVYRPSWNVTRGQMAAFLYRQAGSPAFTAPAVSPFTDVSTTQAFYKEMAWLRAQGITNGWVNADGTRTYKPHQAISRDQMAAFLYRLAGKPAYTAPATSPFKDVRTTQGFYKEMAWMEERGIANGWSDGTYRPVASVERGVMAAFLQRFDAHL